MDRRQRSRDEPRAWYPVVLAFGIGVVLAAGTWGFARRGPGTVWDHFYRSLQLFVLESGEGLVAPLPWQLQFARLAAPALTVASTVAAAVVLSRNRIDRLRARHSSGHVVVCGLDHHGAAALALHDAGSDVVAIVADPAASGARYCRRAGIPVVVGDPRDPLVLRDAGVPAAAHVVVASSSLDICGRVALATVDLAEGRTGPPLSVHVEIGDPELAALLRALKLTEHRATTWQIEDLDLAGAGSRAMLDEVRPWPSDATTARLLVVGRSPLAGAVAREARRRWERAGRPADGLTITRVDQSTAWRESGVGRPVSAVYVCDPDETTALTTALAITAEMPEVPVLVRLEQATAFGALVGREAPTLHVMSVDQAVLTPGVLLDSTTERVARALHDSYRRTATVGDPSAVPWTQLPESLRQSNRSQATHIADKVRATHRVLLPDDGQPPDDFSQEELDLLGRLEHERWVEERRSAGWTSGPRDPQLRTTPFLVPWEDLSEEVRDIDRQFVRELPSILADAGLVLRRVSPDLPEVRGRGTS